MEDATEVSSEVVADHSVIDAYDDGSAAAVWELVKSLPRKQRTVIVLRYYEQLSEAEIAHTMGISTGTVKSQASRALAALRQRVPDALTPGEEER